MKFEQIVNSSAGLSRILLYSDETPHSLYHRIAEQNSAPGLFRSIDAWVDDSKLSVFRNYALYNSEDMMVVLEMSRSFPSQQGSLLKILEEDTNLIVLHSSKPLLKTIESRMQLIAVLHPDKPQEPQEEERLRYHDKLPTEERNLVIRALKALHDHDGAALNALALRWTDATTEAMRQWCSEAISQQWRQFGPEDSQFTGVQMPLAILLAVSKNVRAKLVVRAGLMGLI